MKKLLIILPFSIFLLLAFAPPLNLINGWYQQFMPNLGGRQISDIFFLDSLTGWAVTNSLGQNDTAYVLKTSNSGDNWTIQYRKVQQWTGYSRIYFLNQNIGFSCGVSQYNAMTGFNKSTDGGISWISLNVPDPTENYLDMSILNIDTQWLVTPEPFAGGVYFTSNGGTNWTHQFSGGNQNPNKIYMFNERIGFISNNSALPNIYKTTNSGVNWIINLVNENFSDMYFIDSLIGWKCSTVFNQADSSVKKTTNGGTNWTKEQLPYGQNITQFGMARFSVINKDTLWGVGNVLTFPNNQQRGILLRTTNGGNNWMYQIPDTTIHIYNYYYINFINKNNGWAYAVNSGIHTTNGGDTTFYTGIQKISKNIPTEFNLEQNYPNPFNPRTVIGYKLKVACFINLKIYDITGKYIIDLVNQKQNAGIYQVDFSGSGLSSGVYFYSLYVDEKLIDTKRMILLK